MGLMYAAISKQGATNTNQERVNVSCAMVGEAVRDLQRGAITASDAQNRTASALALAATSQDRELVDAFTAVGDAVKRGGGGEAMMQLFEVCKRKVR